MYSHCSVRLFSDGNCPGFIVTFGQYQLTSHYDRVVFIFLKHTRLLTRLSMFIVLVSVARFPEAIYRTFLANVGLFPGHYVVRSDKQSGSHTDPLLFQFYCIFMPLFSNFL